MHTKKLRAAHPKKHGNARCLNSQGSKRLRVIFFDVEMDFTRKASFVANGSTTEAPVAICYSSGVSRDSIRIAFLIAVLNELDIFACDIGSAYLNAPCQEKIWFKAGI